MASAVGVSPGAATPLVPDEAAVARPTLTDLAVQGGISSELASSLWGHLDLDPLTDMEVAAAIPPERLAEYIEGFVNAQELSAGKMGRITLLFTKLREGPSASAVGPREAFTLAPASAAPLAAVVTRGQMSLVLDQSDASAFDRLDPAQRAQFRKNHISACGGPPLPDREPSPDQLAAMFARLARGESPYADFAVFQPHGRRLARCRLFDAQVFVDGS